MRIILYSGKGGVGKTSLAAATAVRAAQLNHQTLVVSTDAAHSLSDVLEKTVGSTPTKIMPHLEALEVDVNQELKNHWGAIQEWLTKFMKFKGLEEAVAEEMAILPGMEELFSLLRIKAFAESGSYDTLVVDCAPTGETIRLLGVPDILNFYFTRIFPIERKVVRSVRPIVQRITDLPLPSDDVFGAVQTLYQQMMGMGPLLKNPEKSSIRIVLNPERMVIKESQRLYTYLNLFGFPVDCVIANRVLPPEARSQYFDRWFEIQSGHLAFARRCFEPLPFFEVRLFDREMIGLPQLSELGHHVFGSKDPTDVLFSEKPMEVRKEEGGYALYIRLPFAEKDRIEVWANGEELVVQVNNQRRHVLLPRTLASRQLLGATFIEKQLKVAFGKKEIHA